MNYNNVELVDQDGQAIGEMEKIAAHENGGRLHRAVSVLLFDSTGRVLLQKRSSDKYHFGGYWANTCCSHPAPGEAPLSAANRTLMREMGMSADLEPVGVFTYHAGDADSSLTEWEYDHVYFGKAKSAPAPNPEEVAETVWMLPSELEAHITNKDMKISPWLIEIFNRFRDRFCAEAAF